MKQRETESGRERAQPTARETDIRVGAKIRAYRLKRGFSLTSLSELTGIAASNLSSIELDKTSPTLATLVKIATAFGVRVGAFLDGVLYRKAVFCRREETEPERAPDGTMSVHRLTGGVSLKEMDARIMAFGKPGRPLSVTPEGVDRFLYCLSGRIDVCVEDETYELTTGDGLYLLPEASAKCAVSKEGDASILVVNPLK